MKPFASVITQTEIGNPVRSLAVPPIPSRWIQRPHGSSHGWRTGAQAIQQHSIRTTV